MGCLIFAAPPKDDRQHIPTGSRATLLFALQLQYRAAGDAAVAHRGQRLAGLFERKHRRRGWRYLALIIKRGDLGETRGHLRLATLAIVADFVCVPAVRDSSSTPAAPSTMRRVGDAPAFTR
jgi:hypothetical protein